MTIRQWLSDKAEVVRVLGAGLVCAIGARIAAPGIDTTVIGDFFRSGKADSLLRLYDWLVGGALGRGALFALGITPYITVRIYMHVASEFFPSLEEPARRRSVTRWLTFMSAVAQSYGFAKFAEDLPGAVANPGTGFVVTTVAALTASAMGVMWLWELGRVEDDEANARFDEHAARPRTVRQRSGEPKALNPPTPELETARHKEPAVVDRP